MQVLTHEQSTPHPRLLDERGVPWAIVPHTPLEEPASIGVLDDLPAESQGMPRVVLRSIRAIEDAESSFASWSNAGWDSFESSLDACIDRLRSASSASALLLWPGAGSVLSDAVSTLSFARKRPEIGLVIEPTAWISQSMLGDAAEHLARFAASLALCESLACVAVRALPEAQLDLGAVEALLTPAIGRADRLLRL